MAEVKQKRLSQVLREFNISLDRAVEFLGSKGFEVESNPNTKITGEEYGVLFEEFETELLEDQAQFLQRTIHLLRTACKEHQTSHTHKLLYPVGSGWMATLSFIHLHLARLGSLRTFITSFLIDWSYSFY